MMEVPQICIFIKEVPKIYIYIKEVPKKHKTLRTYNGNSERRTGPSIKKNVNKKFARYVQLLSFLIVYFKIHSSHIKRK